MPRRCGGESAHRFRGGSARTGKSRLGCSRPGACAMRSALTHRRTTIGLGAGERMRGRGQGEGAAAREVDGDDGGEATVLLVSKMPPPATGSSPSIHEACPSSWPDQPPPSPPTPMVPQVMSGVAVRRAHQAPRIYLGDMWIYFESSQPSVSGGGNLPLLWSMRQAMNVDE